MKVSAINYSINQNYAKGKVTSKHVQANNIAFDGKGKFLGGLLGGAAGGAAGGAIIGGGTLAGAALLAASGPVGWGLAALYTVGGAVAGSWLGSEAGDFIENKNKSND